MKDCLEQFFNYLIAEKNYARNTVIGYSKDIEQYINEVHITSPEQISKANIRAFLAILERKEDTVKARSRNRKLAAIKLLCKFLKAEGLISENPSLEIEYAKIGKQLPVVFSEEDMSNLIESAEDQYRDKAVLELLYGIGVRVAELVGIKVSDINFTSQTVKVLGKWNKERIVPVNTNCLVAVVTYLRKRNIDSEFLFPSPYNSDAPISVRTIRNIVYRYGDINSLKNISPHKFRHSCATHLHQHGMDIRDVQEMLGHADISSTTIYTQVALNSLSKSYHSAHPRE